VFLTRTTTRIPRKSSPRFWLRPARPETSGERTASRHRCSPAGARRRLPKSRRSTPMRSAIASSAIRQGGVEALGQMALQGSACALDEAESALLDADLQTRAYQTAETGARWVDYSFAVRYTERGMTALQHPLYYREAPAFFRHTIANKLNCQRRSRSGRFGGNWAWMVRRAPRHSAPLRVPHARATARAAKSFADLASTPTPSPQEPAVFPRTSRSGTSGCQSDGFGSCVLRDPQTYPTNRIGMRRIHLA
jgi:hypothetical protein